MILAWASPFKYCHILLNVIILSRVEMLVDCRAAVQTASRVEERPHKLYRILNNICHQTRQRPNTGNRLIVLFYRRPPPLELNILGLYLGKYHIVILFISDFV